eukprot:2430285-Amphidinium_carterae.1
MSGRTARGCSVVCETRQKSQFTSLVWGEKCQRNYQQAQESDFSNTLGFGWVHLRFLLLSSSSGVCYLDDLYGLPFLVNNESNTKDFPQAGTPPK